MCLWNSVNQVIVLFLSRWLRVNTLVLIIGATVQGAPWARLAQLPGQTQQMATSRWTQACE